MPYGAHEAAGLRKLVDGNDEFGVPNEGAARGMVRLGGQAWNWPCVEHWALVISCEMFYSVGFLALSHSADMAR